jgi:hypothetical protein
MVRMRIESRRRLSVRQLMTTCQGGKAALKKCKKPNVPFTRQKENGLGFTSRESWALRHSFIYLADCVCRSLYRFNATTIETVRLPSRARNTGLLHLHSFKQRSLFPSQGAGASNVPLDAERVERID